MADMFRKVKRFKRRDLREAAFDSRYDVAGVGSERCVYCGFRAVVMDHVPPISRAGNYPLGFPFRLYPACHDCNQRLCALDRVCLARRVRYLLRQWQSDLASVYLDEEASDGDFSGMKYLAARIANASRSGGDFSDACECPDCRPYAVNEGAWSASEWHGAVSANTSIEAICLAQDSVSRYWDQCIASGLSEDLLQRLTFSSMDLGALMRFYELLDTWQKACASGAGTVPGSIAEN